MAKDCPYCGLVNTPHAQRCDCGYEFTTGHVGASTLNDRDKAVNAQNAESQAVPIPGGPLGCVVFVLLILTAYGGNASGVVVVATSLVCAIPVGYSETGSGGFLCAWGAMAVVLECGSRSFVHRVPVLDFWRGGRIAFLPVWLFGLLVFTVGVALLVAKLLSR